MKTTITKKIVAFTVAFTTILVSTPKANAKELTPSIKDRVSIAERTMEKDKISPKLKDELINKIKKGEKLESEKENSIPVSIEKFSEGEFDIKKEIFSDNSYIITKVTNVSFIEKNGTPLMTRDSWDSWISNGGTIVSSDGFHKYITGATVRKSHGAYYAEFSFDYSYHRDGGEIHYTYSENSSSVGGTMSLGSSKIIKSKSNYSGPARAEMQFSFSGYSGVASYSGVVGITVNQNGCSTY